MKLSVVTCCYNPDPVILQRVLDSLRAQTLPAADWEYVLVDNNSRPPLSELVDVKGLPSSRIVVEPQAGTAHARARGLRETKAPIVLFVDDDSILAPDYMAKGLELLERNPFVGVLGGYGEAEYQAPVEDWMKPYLHIHVDHRIVPARQQPLQYAMTRVLGPWIPVGAGMFIRRAVAELYEAALREDAFRRSLGPQPDVPAGSEDEDIACTAIDHGWASATSSLIRFTHVIRASRMTRSYFLRVLYTRNYLTGRLLVHRGWRAPVPPRKETWYTRLRDALWYARPKPAGVECEAAFHMGYHDGLSGRPFNPRYR